VRLDAPSVAAVNVLPMAIALGSESFIVDLFFFVVPITVSSRPSWLLFPPPALVLERAWSEGPLPCTPIFLN